MEKHESERVRFPMAGPRGKEGSKRSFRIESKRFDIESEVRGPHNVKFSERGKYHQGIVLMGKEGARWLGRCITDNITREGDKAFVRTFLEHGKTYVNWRESNSYGRFIDVTECGRGRRRGRIVIPEGQKQSGWRGFLKELQLFLNPEKTGKPSENQGIQQEAIQGKRGERSYAAIVLDGGQRQQPRKEEHQFCGEESGAAVESTMRTGIHFDGTKKRPNGAESGEIPEIMPQTKKRSPLQFFPNLEPLSEKREFGTGLTIMVNAAGQRSVLRRSNDNISVTKQGVPRTKDFQDAQHRGGLPNQSRRWVPRQRVLTKDKQGVGFTSEPKGQQKIEGPRSIYEKGESSGSQSWAVTNCHSAKAQYTFPCQHVDSTPEIPQLTDLDEEKSSPRVQHKSELTGAHGMKLIPFTANDRAANGLSRHASRAQLCSWPGKSRETDGFLFSLQGYPIPLSFTVVSSLSQNLYQEEWCIPSQAFEDYVGWSEDYDPENTSEIFEQTERAIISTEVEEVLEVQPLSMVTGPEKSVEPSEWVLE